MNAPKCTEYDYINFLVAPQQVCSAVEASRSHLEGEQPVVQGINLSSLVWSDGDAALPCDYRLSNKDHDGLSKNDHFSQMLQQAYARGFQPRLVAFDSWYSSLENLKLVRSFGWEWLTRLKSNRQVSLKAGQQQAVSALDIPPNGLAVHLRGYGMVKVFRTVDPHGNAEYWATSRLTMTDAQRELFANRAWLVEVYHRALKQFTGIERGLFRLERSQHNHIGLALRAYVRLELHRWKTRTSICSSKLDIIRLAVRHYLAHPIYPIPSTA